MSKKIFNPILFSLFVLIASSCVPKQTNNVNGIIPLPVKFEQKSGVFKVNNNTKIIINSEELISVGKVYAKEFNIESPYISNSSENGAFFLTIDTLLPSEGYSLDISENKVNIKGGDKAGVFYALQSLKQLRVSKGIPSVNINDFPRFGYRGMMLDVSRYFYTVEEVKKFLDLMALHKYNKFHWHLTDDQGWRIEIKKYPKLTEIGSVRQNTMKGHFKDSKDFDEIVNKGNMNFSRVYKKDSNDYDGKPHGGYYTQDQIKEIVAFATERFIEVIPEIEMPGHSTAALAAYPEYSCSKKPIEVSGRWSVHTNLYCPTNETFIFLKDVLSEVMELFPSEYLHIGGDEAKKDQWKKCGSCQNLIKKHELEGEHELQSYFIEQIDEFLTSKGKKLVGWDEILEGGLSPNATVMSWQGENGGIEAAKQKHNVIMAPYTALYFDYYQDSAEAANKSPLAQGGLLTLDMVYNYEPYSKELTSEEHKYILGAQGCVWTEYISSYSYIEYMSLPRMTALSEVLWVAPDKKNWDNFITRLQDMFLLYDKLGIEYAKHYKTNN